MVEERKKRRRKREMGVKGGGLSRAYGELALGDEYYTYLRRHDIVTYSKSQDLDPVTMHLISIN